MQDWINKEAMLKKWESADNSAAAAVMRKAAAGRPITVAALGGSITEGFHSSCPEKSYAGIMRAWWETKFPDTRINYINAGIGATDSYLGLHRAQRDVLQFEPDFVIVDFTVNDQAEEFYQKSYDKLMKVLLGAKSRPAVVLLFMTMEDGTSAREYHARVAAKYQLPVIDYGSAILTATEKGVYRWNEISPDDIHPNDRGHALVGGMVCDYLDYVYASCGQDGGVDPAADSAAPVCAILDSALTVPVSQGGWQKADLHPHLHDGWLGSAKTGVLEFELVFANLGLTYLKSVDGSFGKAEIYVDGEYQKTLDGDFTGGWGDYGQSDEVYTSDHLKTHRVQIKVVQTQKEKEVKFGVLALLISSDLVML